MNKRRMQEQLPDGVLRRNDPAKAKLIAGRVLESATKADDRQRIVQALHLLASCALDAGDLETAEEHIDRARSLAVGIGDNHLVAIGISYRMQLLNMRGEHSQALELGRVAFDLLGDSSGLSYPRMLVLLQITSAYHRLADYARTLAYLLEAVRYEGDVDTMLLQGLVCSNIGSIYRLLGDRQLALEYLQQGIDLKRACGDRRGEMRTLVLIGYEYLEVHRPDDAIAAFEQGLEIARSRTDRGMEGKILSALGNAYALLGDHDRALEYMREALAIVDELGDEHERVNVLTYLADISMARNDHDAALVGLHEAVAIGERIGDPLLLWKPHELLAGIYDSLGNATYALHHYRAFVTIMESLSGRKQQLQAARIQVESERRILEQERENHRLEAAALEKDLEYRTNQMTLLTTSLIQKRESLEKIQRDLRVIAEADARSSRRVKSLLEKVEEMLRSEQDWQTFERHFHQLHQGFIRGLAEQYPTLTPTELKICSLLKTNCSTKEIAAILCISRHTVDGHRASIRRKLGLSADENLTAFLARSR